MTNLSYKDAKELREAGYPQKGLRSFTLHVCGGSVCENVVYLNPYHPSLSELIEACGYTYTGMDSFDLRLQLLPLAAGWKASASKAVVLCENDFVETKNFNSTPEQAVKNLWIKLNKK